MSVARAWIAGLASSLWALGAAAASDDVLADLSGTPSVATRLEQVSGTLETAYQSVLAEYEALAEQAPYDIAQQVARCEFMEEFAATYEYASFIDDVYDQQTRCAEDLRERYPEHPAAILYGVQQTYGEDRLEQGRRVLQKMGRQYWTYGQAASLYTMLAETADDEDDDGALDYALKALEYDERANVRLIAAKRLIDKGDKRAAFRVLTSPVDGMDQTNAWWLVEKLKLLAQLNSPQRVVDLYEKLSALEPRNRIQTARALRDAGLISLARQELAGASNEPAKNPDERMELFKLELEFGEPQAALDAYNALRDLGVEKDPMAVNRIAIALRDPTLPWRARDFVGLATVAAVIMLTALLVGIPLSFVHYRGLAVRARLGDPYPREGWQLRHAWLALVAFGVAQVLALCCAGPVDFGDGSWQSGLVGIEPRSLATAFVVQAFLALLLLLPIARLSQRIQPAWWGTEWTITRSIVIGAVIGVATRLPFLAVALAGKRTMPLQDPLWSILDRIQDDHGYAAAIWVLALAAPVIEELIFRGVLLRSLSAHIPFVWANALQAALFAAAHMNLSGAIILFPLGMLLGWLTRRSGGLLAPLVLHAVFNLIAAFVLLGDPPAPQPENPFGFVLD